MVYSQRFTIKYKINLPPAFSPHGKDLTRFLWCFNIFLLNWKPTINSIMLTCENQNETLTYVIASVSALQFYRLYTNCKLLFLITEQSQTHMVLFFSLPFILRGVKLLLLDDNFQGCLLIINIFTICNLEMYCKSYLLDSVVAVR